METIAKFIISSFPPAVIFFLLILFFPEKIQKWAAFFWYLISKLGSAFKFAHKRAVKLDLQGRLNDYVKTMSKDVPQISKFKVEVELVDEHITKQSFLDDGKVIVRLRRDDLEEQNFVHGSYLFVSTCLLFRSKRYISKSQREALDLFVTTRLLEKEKPSVVDFFLDEYLHPELKDSKSKTSNYYDKYAHIDKGGLFYPVLLEELDFLGGKVFGQRRDDKIISEVDGLVNFLEGISNRKVGDDQTDLDYKRDYCRFAIMIIGKKFKLADSINPYVKFIRKKLFEQEIETIYILGKIENKQQIIEICNNVGDLYWEYRSRETVTNIKYEDGSIEKVKQYILVLRIVGASVFQPSE